MKHYFVEGKTLPEAYHKALITLNENGEIIECPAYNTYTKECGMTMFVEEPLSEPMISRCWVGGHHELQQYVMEICDGILDFMIGADDNVWEYTYHDRIKDQIPFVLEDLKCDKYSRRAVIDVRKNSVDMFNSHPACLQHMHFLHRNNKLDFRVLMRSNDAPEATFMNSFGFIALQKKIADTLNCDVGTYMLTANSFHAYEKNFDNLDDFCNRIKSGKESTYNYNGFYDELMKSEIPSIEAMVKDQYEKYYK